MLNNYPLEKHTHKCFMIICTKNCVLPMQSWQNILHFSSGHSVGHVKKVWPFQEKIVTFFPWNLAFSVTGKKIKRLYLHIQWKIITIGPYSCLLYKLKKTGHSEGHPPVEWLQTNSISTLCPLLVTLIKHTMNLVKSD